MSTDDQLSQWRDAAVGGGLPLPTRDDRWQPLRAGVVNLWEFEVAEYWYADGWVQLTGRNETGKSSLMALTTLIPWLADTASSNIDTLGTSGKTFRYYVGASGEPGDRRVSDASTHHGWLWVEYGRNTPDGPRYFSTMLFADARSASANLKLRWCTLAGETRVRDGVHLTHQRTVVQPKEIEAPGFLRHDTATTYRAEVAKNLLGSTPERLTAVGRILKVTRTPKLGEQLKVSFIQQHLLGALPELNRSEIDKLAEGWEQLDQIREDLKQAEQAAATVDKFASTAWAPWARATLRLAADQAAAARSRFDQVTKEVREAEAALRSAEDSEGSVRERTAAATRTQESTAAAATELRQSAQYRDAQSRLLRAETADRDERAAAKREESAARLQQMASEAHDGAARDVAHAEEAATQAVRLADKRADHVRAAAVTAHLQVGENLDPTLLNQQARDREGHLTEARKLLRAADLEDQAATTAESVAALHHDQSDESRAAAEQAWTEATNARDELTRRLDAWASELTWDVDVESWQQSLPGRAEEAGHLSERIRHEWHEPLHRAAMLQEQRADGAIMEAEAEVARLTVAIERIRSEGASAPAAPALWSRRERPADGASLWQLINPVDGLPETELASVEAALAAAGVLDAWVDEEGIHGMVDDVVIAPDDPVEQNLTHVLTAADGRWADRVTRFLCGVQLVWADAALPATGLAVSLDGRWRNSGVAGHAAPLHGTAEWIGEAAREAQRQRLIAELDRQRTTAHQASKLAHTQRAAAVAELSALSLALRAAPTDVELGRLLGRAADAETRAERDAERAEVSRAAANQARAAADATRARFLDFAGTHALPATHDELDEAERTLRALGTVLLKLTAAREAHSTAQATLAREERRRIDAATRLDEAAAGLANAAADHARAHAKAAELRLSIGADDASLLRRLDALEAEQARVAQELKGLGAELLELTAARTKAEVKLEASAAARDDATTHRDATYRRFRHWIDEGFDERLGIDLPARESSTVQAVREQVAVLRDKVRPRNWTERPDEAERMVSARRDALVSGAHDTRMELERGGRSLRVDDELGYPQVSVMVDSNGTSLPLHQAQPRLRAIHGELEQAYNSEVQRTLRDLLGSTFLHYLRDRVGETKNLIKGINAVLLKHPTGTDRTVMRIDLTPREGLAEVVHALESGALVNDEVFNQVQGFLKGRIDEAKRAAAERGDLSWRDGLAEQLDYRGWYDVHLRQRNATSAWRPLTTTGFAKLSGGARAVMLMMPLVATLAALYAEMDAAPRPLWLDEAFDGLDAGNRSMVMGLLRDFDLDVLLVGPGRLVNVAAVPTAAIYQVVRAPAPEPGADLTLELWAGGTLEAIDLPLTWDTPATEAASGQESLL